VPLAVYLRNVRRLTIVVIVAQDRSREARAGRRVP